MKRINYMEHPDSVEFLKTLHQKGSTFIRVWVKIGRSKWKGKSAEQIAKLLEKYETK